MPSRYLVKSMKNCHAIVLQGERRVRGGGIYLTAALLNHECLPNVAR